jgi:hypothetical protein
MPLELPQSYKFKYFFFSWNLVINFYLNGASFSHGLQGSSPPLFSPCNYDPSNIDHDDNAISLDEFDPHLEIDLPIVPSKLIIHKKNYDAFRRFQDSWVIKLP